MLAPFETKGFEGIARVWEHHKWVNAITEHPIKTYSCKSHYHTLQNIVGAWFMTNRSTPAKPDSQKCESESWNCGSSGFCC